MWIFGYIDPGTGSLFIQAVLGIALAGTVAFRSYIRRAYEKVKVIFAAKNSQ